MEVHIVVSGTYYEGSRILSVHADRMDARTAALLEVKRIRFEREWLESVSPHSGHVYWTDGCDYVTIETHEVKQ